MTLNEIANVILKGRNIAIMPHISADGDALGSSLALGLALKKLNRRVTVFLEEDIPYTYRFLHGREMVHIRGEQSKDLYYDTVVALDNGDLNRLGSRRDMFYDAEITLNIDHHTVNAQYAMYNYVDETSSAVGEIIYEILNIMGVQMDSHIAECLYVAISTDTGGFRFSNTTSLTHRIASSLIDVGIDVADICRKVFEEVSYEKVKLMGAAVDSLELVEDGRLSVVTIDGETLKETGAKEEDFDGLVNIGRNVRGVEAAVLLREVENNEIRVNLRSNSYLDVSEVARYFSGGGHKKAAGCTIKASLDEAKLKVVREIGKRFKK